MNFHNRTLRWASLPDRIRGMFNLNDPRWGRGDDKSEDGGVRPEDRPSAPPGGQGVASNGRAMASSHRILMSFGVISIASLVVFLVGKTARAVVPVEVRVAAFSQI